MVDGSVISKTASVGPSHIGT
jgi:hypothetical protein